MSSENPLVRTVTVADTLFFKEASALVTRPARVDSASHSPGPLSAETQSVYMPSTGTDPSGHMDHDQRTREVKREMDGHWIEGDDTLIDQFFPLASVSQEDIRHVKRELYNPSQKRWMGIPNKVKKEKHLVRALLNFIVTIRRHFGIGPDRDVFDTQDRNIATHDGAMLKPDFFVSGLSPLISSAIAHEDHPTSFKQCTSFAEAKLHFSRNDAEDRAQMATYAREVLMAQSNRRFVPSFLVTERILQFFLFDRSGALRSANFDYHRHPEQACAVFAIIFKLDTASLGFDRTIFYRTPSAQCIQTLEPTTTDETQEVNYVVEMLLMRSYIIVGSGTTYWRVRREGDPDPSVRYIIKDSWITANVNGEQALFKAAGNLRGVAPLLHHQIIRTVGGFEDSSIHNRLTKYAAIKTVDRVHTRAVYKSSGKLWEHFEDPMQLLMTFLAAVEGEHIRYLIEPNGLFLTGHRNLLAQGLLHRDIVPWNILINLAGGERDRGALIDLDCAMRTSEPTHRAERTPGSWLFLPRSVLRGVTTPSYMDDLEAFFHIFCFFVVAHTGPTLASSRIKDSGDLEGYGGSSRIALLAKDSLFESDTFKLTVQTAYFKEPVEELAVDLHAFFYTRWRDARDATRKGQILPPPNPTNDYSVFLGYISNAIHKLSLACGDYHPMSSSDVIPAARPSGPVLPLRIHTVPKKVPDDRSQELMERGSRKRGLEGTLEQTYRRYPSRERKRARRGP